MHWTTKADIIADTTTLGHRQAQIYVLDQQDLTTNKIHTELTAHTDNPPQKSTIRNTKHTVKNKLYTAAYTTKYHNNKSVRLRPPLHPPTNTNPDIQLYFGQIGSGKTVTAMTHYLTKQRENNTPTVIIDPFDAWINIPEINNEQNTVYTPSTTDDTDSDIHAALNDYTTTPNAQETLFNQAITDWLNKPTGAELILDHTSQYMQQLNLKSLLKKHIETDVLTPNNKTIRIVTQQYTPDRHFPDITPSQIHYTRNERLAGTNNRRITRDELKYVHNASPGESDSYAQVLTKTRSGDTFKSAVKLTDAEKQAIEPE